jgi:hypothetical protein
MLSMPVITYGYMNELMMLGVESTVHNERRPGGAPGRDGWMGPGLCDAAPSLGGAKAAAAIHAQHPELHTLKAYPYGPLLPPTWYLAMEAFWY